MSLLPALAVAQAVTVKQRRELAELVGFETRNKYEVVDDKGAVIGFAAEQQKGFLGFLLRHFLGHWRSFEVHVFDAQRALVLNVLHPFRWFFQRLEVRAADGRMLGAVQQRLAFINKRFDIVDAQERVIFSVSSPIWRIWTFPFERLGREVARVEKRWNGLLNEAFTDKDSFRVTYLDALTQDERALVLAASLFIDLQYFERKASN